MIYADFYFDLFLMLIVAAGLIAGACLFYIIFQWVRAGRFNKQLKKLLTNSYIDPESLKNFYEKNRDAMEKMPLTSTEIMVFRD